MHLEMGAAQATAAPMPAHERGRALLLALGAVSILGLTAHAALAVAIGQDTVAARILFTGEFLIAAVTALTRAALVPRDRLLWALVGLAVVCFVLGDLYFELRLGANEQAPYPSLADIGYLAFYPFMAAALTMGLRARRGGLRGLVALDVVAGALTAAAVGASLAYPTAGVHEPGTLLDTFWVAGAACWAIAAVLRGDVASFGATRRRAPAETWPALFATTAIGILLYDHFHRTNLASLVLSVATLGVAVARMVLTLRDHRRLLAARERDMLTDDLTGLPNRRGFAAAAGRQLAVGRRRGETAAILTVGIDRLKYVNDALGQEAGDALIVSVADLLAGELRDGDLAARLGGDEFAIVLHDTDGAGARACAERLCAAVRRTRFADDIREGQVTASVGVGLVPGWGETSLDAALANASAAMYAAKERGRDSYAIHGVDADGASVLKERFDWSTRLRRALSEDTFELYAQPIVTLADGQTCAHELLLRLREDERLWSPGVFLPEAERFGLMPEIDRWVIARAIELARTAPTPVTVNISPASVNDATSRRIVLERLRAAALPAGRLVFEVTEQAAVESTDVARAFADQLRELGCPLALDDFGVAFSSFQSLKQLPFDVVKIDGSLIRDVLEDEMDGVFVEAIARAARRIGKRTVAEHVTSHEAVSLLRELGVDMAQAYLLGEPAPVAVAFAAAPAKSTAGRDKLAA